MKRNLFFVAAGLGLAQQVLIPSLARAQENQNKPLDEVVVTATRSQRKLSEIGRTVTVISSRQLEQSQGRTLPEVLNNVGGLTISGTGSGFGSNPTVFMRGASAGNTLILIDGVPVNNGSGVTGEYDLSAIPVDQVDRVEILRGVNSTLYGSDAVAGVINIITKKAGRGKLGADLLVTSGSYRSFKSALGLKGSVGRTGIAVNFSNSSSKGFSTALDTTGVSGFDRDGISQHALNVHLLQDVSNRFSLGSTLQLTQNIFDLDNGAFSDDSDYKGKNSFLFAGLNARYALPKGLLTFNLTENDVWNRFSNGPADFSGTSSQDNAGKITYSEVLLTQSLFKQVDLTAGANYRYTRSDQAYESMSDFGPYNTYMSSDSAHNSIFSSFASVFYGSDRGLNLELGTRYNRHSDYGNNFTYTFNPSFVLKERYKIFLSIASAYKVPTVYQLYSLYGNQQLKPESSTSYEAGTDLDLIPRRLHLIASVFKRRTSDLIYFYTDPVTYRSNYKNGNLQDDKGFELEADGSPFKKMTLNAWFAYVKGRGRDASGSESNFLFRRPARTWGGTVGYQPAQKLSVNLTYRYTGRRPEQFFNPVSYAPEIISLKPYSLLDAYLQLTLNRRLAVFADIKNIFDENYIEWLGYATRGRNFNAGVRYSVR